MPVFRSVAALQKFLVLSLSLTACSGGRKEEELPDLGTAIDMSVLGDAATETRNDAATLDARVEAIVDGGADASIRVEVDECAMETHSCTVDQRCVNTTESFLCVQVQRLVAGENHTCALLDDAAVKCWGLNLYGQLGYGDEIHRKVPATTAVNIGSGRSAIALSAGRNHTCALLDDASLKCWGSNGYGQLGYGDMMSRSAPATTTVNLGSGRSAVALAAGSDHTCAILDDASVKCWGSNVSGQLGYGDDVLLRSAPPATRTVNLGSGRSASGLAVGDGHTCVVLDNASLKCWGANGEGELGYGDTDPYDAPTATTVDLGSGRSAVGVVLSYAHACALLDNASIKCWGANTYGQLGYGDTASRRAPAATTVDLGSGRSAIALDAGNRYTCALLDDASVKCWGSSGSGQLGYGDNMNRSEPATTAIDLGTERSAIAFAAGDSHACALLDDTSVKCWGANSYGQLGYGDTNNRSAPGDVVLRLDGM